MDLDEIEAAAIDTEDVEVLALIDIARAAALWARGRQALPSYRSVIDDRLIIALERAGL